jgi:hypothetical protein
MASFVYKTLLPARFGISRPWISYTLSVGNVTRRSEAVSFLSYIFGEALILSMCSLSVLVTVSTMTDSSFSITEGGSSILIVIVFSIKMKDIVYYR